MEIKRAKISYKKQRSKFMPVIHLQGYSLIDSGFEIGDNISITIQAGLITIKKELPTGKNVFYLNPDVQLLIDKLSLVEV
jgi:hypothetical protein